MQKLIPIIKPDGTITGYEIWGDFIYCKGGCGKESLVCEQYMVHNELWMSLKQEPSDILCLSCLEIKLGRSINISDLTDAPINTTAKFLLKKMK